MKVCMHWIMAMCKMFTKTCVECHCIYTYCHPYINTTYQQAYVAIFISYIANHSRWKSFTVFTGQSVTAKLFQWNSLCNRLCIARLLSNHKCFQQITVYFCYHETFSPRTIYNIQYTISSPLYGICCKLKT